MSRKPTYKFAIGLEYDAGKMEAPIIGAKGRDYIADDLVKLAKRFGVPVVEKGNLCETLSYFETGTQIPEDLYNAVAVVLAELEKEKKDE